MLAVPDRSTVNQLILEDIQFIQSKWPGGNFALYNPSEHHDVALMEWQLISADGTPSVRGNNAVRVTPDGKFSQITTFAPSTLEQTVS